jgi:plasmid stability protein
MNDCIIVILQSLKANKRICIMAILTVRNVPDDVHRALRMRAAQHGRSTEAEVREILAVAVKPEKRVRMGETLASIGYKIGLSNDDFAVFESIRDKTPAKPVSFD